MNMTQLDLNLLKVLLALLDTRSITQAGERLGYSQPAASRAVARLRKCLADPLLVRTSSGYALTPRAASLEPSVRAALALTDQIFAPPVFEPRDATRVFTVATTDYGMLAVLAPALDTLALQAPSARFSVQPWRYDTFAALEHGRADMALYADDPLPQDFHFRDLYRESYAVLMRRAHPLTQDADLAPEAFLLQLAKFPQVIASYPSGRNQLPDDVLARLLGTQHRVALEMPYFLAAASVLGSSDRVMVMPARAAQSLSAQADLQWLPIAGNGLGFSYRMVWHERVHRDPAVAWLRAQLFQSAGKA